jgi:uncharacterized protein YceK
MDPTSPARIRTRRPGRLIVAAGAAVCCVVALSGCSQVNSAIDAGQSAVSSATGAVQAAADVAAACVVAQAAWVPGVSPSQARAAVGEALGLVDAAFAIAPTLPGVQEVRELLMNAKQSLADNPDESTLGVSRGALETACALFAAGG